MLESMSDTNENVNPINILSLPAKVQAILRSTGIYTFSDVNELPSVSVVPVANLSVAIVVCRRVFG